VRLETAVSAAQRGEAEYVLLYVDLDQFKIVNDTCGHSAGDRLLRDITSLLQTRVRASDTIARLGGDEFGLLLERCSLEQAERVADSIRQAIHGYRFLWGANSLSVGASIGVVRIGRETTSAGGGALGGRHRLLRGQGWRAAIACRSTNVTMAPTATARCSGWGVLRAPSRTGGWSCTRSGYFPPRPCGATRPRRPRHLFMSSWCGCGRRRHAGAAERVHPGRRALQRHGHGRSLGREPGHRAAGGLLQDHRSPAPAGRQSLGTSINDEDFLDFVMTRLTSEQVARALCFEITETAAVASLAKATFLMRELKARGCRFALDDFGSGVSSFVYLKTLPVDFLKIDGQFAAHVATDAVDRSMVEAIAKIGRAMDVATIAEKVENAEVLTVLKNIGVDYIQGFHLAEPCTIDEVFQP
jgi:diguanylate cyclase (GGDEF)-like protein